MKKQVSKLPQNGPRMVGYARVSTEDQKADMQIAALVNAGVNPDNVWHERASGVAARRPELGKALADVRAGETFIVWKLDRLGRNLRDLLEKLHDLERRGVKFRSLTEGIDTSTPSGRLILHVIGALAEFERDLVVERTKAGARHYQANGGRLGQPSKVVGKVRDKAIAMLKAGKSVTQVAAACGVAPGTIYNHFSASVIAAIRDGTWEDESN